MRHEVIATQVPEYSFSVTLWVHRTCWSAALYRPMDWHRLSWTRYHGARLLELGPFTFRYNRVFSRWYRLSVRRFHITVYR